MNDERLTEPPAGGPGHGTETPGSPDKVRTGFIVGRDGKPLRVVYRVEGELAILEGDIVLGRASEIATSAEQLQAEARGRPGGPDFGAVIIGFSYRWPRGVVPYVIDPALPNQSRVTAAIAHVESNTPGVDFVVRSGQTNYVRFVPSTTRLCTSYIGMRGGMQPINLHNDCTTGNTVHEIGHALGMFHEQTRCDRNTYVQILWENIQAGYEGNFISRCDDRTDLFDYAEGSVMHYPPYAFSANGLPTIRSLRGLDHLMGQQNGLGTTDISTINRLYPPPSTSWLSRAALPTPRRGLAVWVVNGLLYAIGGANSAGTALTSVAAYNPTTNTWTSRAPLPAARQTGNGAATINGIMYLAGGHDAAGALTRTLYAYNASTNTWSSKANMPVFSSCGGSAVHSGKLYVFSGCTRSTTGTQVAAGLLHRYDPNTNTWTALRAAPAAHFQPVVSVLGGKLYVIGGTSASNTTFGRVDIYNPATNAWTVGATMPTPRVGASGSSIGGKLQIIGGRNGSNYLSTVEAYDPVTNSWTQRPSMLTARAALGVAGISGFLYAVGGRNSVGVLSSNERYTP